MSIKEESGLLLFFLYECRKENLSSKKLEERSNLNLNEVNEILEYLRDKDFIKLGAQTLDRNYHQIKILANGIDIIENNEKTMKNFNITMGAPENPKIRDKLEEASFFLKKLKKSKNEKELKYNLSAFLSSSRSVTFVIQKEFFNIKGFKYWWLKKREEIAKDKIMRLFINKRNITEKERSIVPDGRMTPNLNYKGEFNPHSWFFHTIEEIDGVKVALFRSVVELSEQYHHKLKELVKEVEDKYYGSLNEN